MENTSMLDKNGKVNWKRLKTLLANDYKANGEVLNDIFPKEAQDYLQIQENHPGLGKDHKGVPTTMFGITEDGCKTAYSADRYVLVPGGVPEFINEAWKALGDKNAQKNHPAEYEALARRVCQYHAWTKSAMLDGWTNGNFSNMPAMSRYATLIQYNNAGGQKMATSLTVQAIRLNNPALLAKSFYSSGKRDDTGAWALAENGLKEVHTWANPGDKAFKNMANAKLIFSDEFPTKEQYAKREAASRSNNGKGAVKDEEWKVLDSTLNNLTPYYYINQDLSQAPEGMEYRKPDAFQKRKQQDEIVGVIDPTKQQGNIQKTSTPEEFRENNAADIQNTENARLQAVAEANPKPQGHNPFIAFMQGVIDLPNQLKKLLNTKNEVNNVNSRNTDDNMQ